MPSNLDRYREDLDTLVDRGGRLLEAMYLDTIPEEYKKGLPGRFGEYKKRISDHLKSLPNFVTEYQSWYSEAKALVSLLLPDRLGDFVRLYEKPKVRKTITYGNYYIEDYLQGVSIVNEAFKKTIVGRDAAIPRMQQQVAIVQAAERRFESSLFDIRQIVQGDLLDSELGAAEELLKHKFTRAAGAVAGVVLERHLAQVCDNHAIKLSTKRPTISDMSNALKDASVIDIPGWRSIQYLADIRNSCDHSRGSEPTAEQLSDLLSGVKRITKTLF